LSQLLAADADLTLRKLVFDGNIGHCHGEHSLVNINSRYPI
jgi:hypothetical protein